MPPGFESIVVVPANGYAWGMKVTILVALCLLAFGAMAAEPAYRIVHPDGTVEFSDQPQQGSEEIDLPEAQSIHTPKTRVKSPSTPQKSEKKAHQYTDFKVLSPAQDAVLRNLQGSLTVSLSVAPQLAPKHQIVVIFDGKEAARGTALSYTLKEVYRGSHTVSAKILNERGKTLKSTAGITFHVHQFSKLYKKSN